MDVLQCGHVAYASRMRLCRHLLGPDGPPDGVDYVRVLSGRGMEYDLCCRACDGSGEPPQFLQVCEGCAERADEDESGMVGWRGRPGIPERPEPAESALTRAKLPIHLRGAFDWVPVAGSGQSEWVFLTARGRLHRFDADTGRDEPLAKVRMPHDPADTWGTGKWQRRHRLHVAASGRYAAVVLDHGSRGVVIDLRTGRTTMTLDGAGYKAHTVPFALAFTEHAGRDVVVHRTNWNRLEVSDAATGESLTDRPVPDAEKSGEHYLDYFHGALHVSPDGRWVLDDGWVWHPVGIPTVWDLRRWLEENPWESEDGPTVRALCMRTYAWDEPVCWISPTLVAVYGIGPDDECLLDGVRVFDAESGTQVVSFPGPSRPLMADDRRLYSGGEDGLQIWDPFTGERTGTVPGFHPERHHPGARELAAVDGDELVRWPTRYRGVP